MGAVVDYCYSIDSKLKVGVPDKETGLGLAISQQLVVEKHGVNYSASLNLGKGQSS